MTGKDSPSSATNESTEPTGIVSRETTLPLNDEPSNWNGRVIANRYAVDRLIARGGMAVVYLATERDLDRKVALKVLMPPPEDDRSRFRDRFRLEARTLAAMSHPNIVTCYDYGQIPDGSCYLAMEYVDGPRLTDLLKGGPIDPVLAVKLVLQVCQALHYAHKQGVVHRDLKTSNLLITKDADGHELVKVVDFGLVKVAEHDQSLTREGVIVGSPHCMAPEQIRGNDTVDARTDIYALGVILFRAVTGSFPFHGTNSTATMIAHLQLPVPSFSSIAPDLLVPEGLEAVVRRCLAKDQGDRPADVRSLASDLKKCIGETSGYTLSMSAARLPPESRQSPLYRYRWALGGAGVVVVLVMAGLGAWMAAVLSRPSVRVVEVPGALGGVPMEARGATETVPAADPSDVPAVEAVAPVSGPPAPPSATSPSLGVAPGDVVAPAPPAAPAATAAPQGGASKGGSEKGAAGAKKAPGAGTSSPQPAPVGTAPEGYMPVPDDFK